jgi:thiamine-monophosphate kinase
MELEFIDWLREHVPTDARARLALSDDAAVVSLSGRSEVVVTTDMLNDGVDFRLEVDDPRRIGRQALGVNLSDLAAMAASPLAVVISLALPRRRNGGSREPLQLAIELYEGLLPLAKEFDIAIAGGDTNTYDGPLVISVTALGELTKRGPLTRSGGRPGDWLLVTGSLGGSILGHLFDFTPRVREAILLHERYELHAGIDISDGLAIDSSRLAAASGCGAVILTDRVPISGDAFRLTDQERPPDRAAAALQHALSDGQDFELLIAAAPDTAQRILRDQPLECPITHVGELVTEPGLWQQAKSGERTGLKPIGWVHL